MENLFRKLFFYYLLNKMKVLIYSLDGLKRSYIKEGLKNLKLDARKGKTNWRRGRPLLKFRLPSAWKSKCWWKCGKRFNGKKPFSLNFYVITHGVMHTLKSFTQNTNAVFTWICPTFTYSPINPHIIIIIPSIYIQFE